MVVLGHGVLGGAPHGGEGETTRAILAIHFGGGVSVSVEVKMVRVEEVKVVRRICETAAGLSRLYRNQNQLIASKYSRAIGT